MKKRPTVVDVARMAGVSAATVSNVLNGTARVTPATHRKVDLAVERLGFVPNQLARSLIRARHKQNAPAHRGSAPHLTTVGYLSVDFTARLDSAPRRDGRMSARSIEKSLGGPAANVAVVAANLGSPFSINTEVVTAIGDDDESEWALAELSAKGVATVSVRKHPGQRVSRCFIIVEADGTRTIVNEPLALQESDLHRYVEAEPSGERAHCLHLEGYQLDKMIDSAMTLRAGGWLTSLQSTGLSDPWLTPAGFAKMTSAFNLSIFDRDSAEAIVGPHHADNDLLEGLAEMLRGTPHGIVLVTLGARGAAFFDVDRDVPVLVPSISVSVVDHTGAGDAFVGAFLAVWLNTDDANLAARHGCVAGALMTTAPNAQGHLPSAGEIRMHLDQCEPVPPAGGSDNEDAAAHRAQTARLT